jgi:DNA-binding transcriptional LysR family regulator
MLPKFVETHPDIVVEILVEQAFTHIVAKRMDAGIRLGESLEKDVVAVPVSAPLRMAVVASPAYLAKYGSEDAPGFAIASLHQHPPSVCRCHL